MPPERTLPLLLFPFPAFFDTIAKACYNLHLVQILVRLTCGLSKKERDRFKAAFESGAGSGAGDLAAYLGHAVAIMDEAGLYKVRTVLSLFPAVYLGATFTVVPSCFSRLCKP